MITIDSLDPCLRLLVSGQIGPKNSIARDSAVLYFHAWFYEVVVPECFWGRRYTLYYGLCYG